MTKIVLLLADRRTLLLSRVWSQWSRDLYHWMYVGKLSGKLYMWTWRRKQAIGQRDMVRNDSVEKRQINKTKITMNEGKESQLVWDIVNVTGEGNKGKKKAGGRRSYS